MRRFRASALLVALALAMASVATANDLPKVRVGVVVDGPWEQNELIRTVTVEELTTLTAGEFDVSFPEEIYLIGDWSYETAIYNLHQLLDDPDVDVIITWGLLASHAVCCLGDLGKPVVAPVIVDPRLQGLPKVGDASGVANLSYVELEDKTDVELGIFRRLAPFEKVYFLANENFIQAIPELASRTLALAAQAGFDVEVLPVGESSDAALAAVPEDAEAVYLWPLFHLSPSGRQRLIDGLNARGLPTFTALDLGDVENGVLGTATSSDFFSRLARRVALNVQRILLGEDAGDIPVMFRFREKIRVNMETAREIGVSPSWDILLEADLVNEEASDLEVMSLGRVVGEAIDANLDLAVQRRALVASEQEIALARASYRPQIDLSAVGSQIDDDRAEASFGTQAERTTSASLEMTQLLFSDPVRTNIRIQEFLQQSRVEELEALRLDIALDAATTYLNLLRARSLVRIERSNLEVTRSNLELAEIRRRIGAANPAEVYRWEAQIATDRKSLVEAIQSRRAAEISLNRLLHRPLEERYVVTEVELDDPSLITGQARFEGYTETPARARVLRDFIVQEGLTRAPELRQLDATIRAQERAVRIAERAYWAPTVALQASLEEVLSRDGAGSDQAELSLADDSNWSVGLSASLPLFTGGERKAELIRAREELTQLNLQLDSVAEQIETRIRVGMQVARGSFLGIDLSRQAAEAARKSLELVSDSYARGAVSILDLLDAQDAALGADQLYANAVYDFFIDLMEVQRAGNRFDFFLTPQERDLWFDRLEEDFERAGAKPLGKVQE